MASAALSPSSSYLNFLEKQVEKANTAYLQVNSVQNAMGQVRERIDLVELFQTDLAKKLQIIESYEGHQANHKMIE